MFSPCFLHPLPIPSSLPSTLFGLASIEGLLKTMDTQRKSRQYNQPPLDLVSSPIPAHPIYTKVQNHKQSESPFRYLNESLANERGFSEKDPADISSSSGRHASSTSRAGHGPSPSTNRSSTPPPSHRRSHSIHPGQHLRSTTPILAADSGRGRSPPRVCRFERSNWSSLSTRLQPWIPIILYGITSLGFVVAIAFWRSEIFQGMTNYGARLCPS